MFLTIEHFEESLARPTLGAGVLWPGGLKAGSCSPWEGVSSVVLRAQSPTCGDPRPCRHTTGLCVWGGETGVVGEGEENPLWPRAGVNAVWAGRGVRACVSAHAPARFFLSRNSVDSCSHPTMEVVISSPLLHLDLVTSL